MLPVTNQLDRVTEAPGAQVAGPRRINVAYLAPWVDFGGSDTGTIDWFKWLNPDRFARHLITTQPSPNRRLRDVEGLAEELWPLPDLMPGAEFPRFILDFLRTRDIRIVHIMNSRLAFDLLADIRGLPDPPQVVVQLHVEEPEQPRYVRYAATRYGNLIDAFSVTSKDLAETLVNTYEVPPEKVHVIYTGVDAGSQFSPTRVRSRPGLEENVGHILFAGRLVMQKDPRLMLRVAAILARTHDFRLHVVGDGELRDHLQVESRDMGLAGRVIFHSPSTDIAAWYAACDILLMTSLFEGIPYTVYEAMAMRLPAVVPDLPGIRELSAADTAVLVSPRDDAPAYAAALARLLDDSEQRRVMGGRARRRVMTRFPVERMATEHEALYAQLLPREGPTIVAAQARPNPPPRVCFRSRSRAAQPLVSVVIPCFNQGLWLPECLESVRQQTYPEIEVIVVDDSSTDARTVSLMARLEAASDLQLLRMPQNSGPGAARNAGVARARGRYILPLDADNRLPPGAVADLVEQLSGAGETVGYIYPNQQFFGNRDDYAKAPAFNLYNLLQQNYIDTGSLFDRDVFDAGLRFAEDIGVSHEDWDFFLQCAARGIEGRPARTATLMTRKWGFNRTDVVEHGPVAAPEVMARRHPDLYGRELSIKARWAPGLSIVALRAEGAAAEGLDAAMEAQSCWDFEVVARLPTPAAPRDSGPHLVALPPELARSESEAAATGLEAARGHLILVTRGTAGELLRDAAFVEKVMRLVGAPGGPRVLAMAGSDVPGRHEFQPLAAAEARGATPMVVAWSARDNFHSADLSLGEADPCTTLLHQLVGQHDLQWRHTSRVHPGEVPQAAVAVRQHLLALSGRRHWSDSARNEKLWRLDHAPMVPGSDSLLPRRLHGGGLWRPPNTTALCRHKHLSSERRILSRSRLPPPGYALEYELGSINHFRIPGTARLLVTSDGTFATDAQRSERPDDTALGYLEMTPFPLLDAVFYGIHRNTGQPLLVSGDDDPLGPTVDLMEHLGWIVPSPLRPRLLPFADAGQGVVQALAAREREMMELQRQNEEKDQQIAALWDRVNGIHNSFPGRVYHAVSGRFPGVKNVLLRRRGGG